MKIETTTLSIKVELQNGIYQFTSLSATGKTRLRKCILQLHSIYPQVTAYSYEDFTRGVDLETIVSRDTKLLVIDRYDMYNTSFHDVINELSKRMIILIDSKSNIYFTDDITPCIIKMTESSIEVL